MKFLVDNQLPVALARFLASRGAQCLHVVALRMGVASDRAIWEYATGSNSVVISKDADFSTWSPSPTRSLD